MGLRSPASAGTLCTEGSTNDQRCQVIAPALPQQPGAWPREALAPQAVEIIPQSRPPASPDSGRFVVRVRVCLPDHARERIRERGGDPASVAAAARRAAKQILPTDRPRKVAVEAKMLPEVVPVILILPRKFPPRVIVKTVLPPYAPGLRNLEVINV